VLPSRWWIKMYILLYLERKTTEPSRRFVSDSRVSCKRCAKATRQFVRTHKVTVKKVCFCGHAPDERLFKDIDGYVLMLPIWQRYAWSMVCSHTVVITQISSHIYRAYCDKTVLHIVKLFIPPPITFSPHYIELRNSNGKRDFGLQTLTALKGKRPLIRIIVTR